MSTDVPEIHVVVGIVRLRAQCKRAAVQPIHRIDRVIVWGREFGQPLHIFQRIDLHSEISSTGDTEVGSIGLAIPQHIAPFSNVANVIMVVIKIFDWSNVQVTVHSVAEWRGGDNEWRSSEQNMLQRVDWIVESMKRPIILKDFLPAPAILPFVRIDRVRDLTMPDSKEHQRCLREVMSVGQS